MKRPPFLGLLARATTTYMDYAAFAPMLPEVRRATFWASFWAMNASSIHRNGVKSARALTGARADIATALSAHPTEIFFAGNGTESDNLAILGVFKHARMNPEFQNKTLHIITTETEHPAVLEACRHLEAVGADVTYLKVDETGRIDMKQLRASLRPETILVSIAYGNSEIGTLQSIRDIAKEIRHFKKSNTDGTQHYPLFHTDACQAIQYENCNVEQLGVDLITWNGTKIGGPSGIAVLYVRRGTPIAPIMYGGGQESGLRSGTENIVGCIGIAKALTIARSIQEEEKQRLVLHRDTFLEQIEKRIPNARINGSRKFRLPNNIHISMKGIQSELLVLELDARGIQCSMGSACASTKDTGSHVLKALYGVDDDKTWGSVRFSIGRTTRQKDIERALKALESIAQKYKKWHH